MNSISQLSSQLPSALVDLATKSLGGVAGLAMPSQTSIGHFTNVSPGITATIIIVVVIILVIWIMLLMSIYKLTDSGLQTVLCFFFGGFYLILALIYYGFSGYKFVKRS